jgi:hypothetical protein
MSRVRFNRILLSKRIKEEVEEKFKEKITKLVEDLKEATPIDTGLAKNSWSLEYKKDSTASIANSQEYIEYLNKGSSQQAPRYFIERTIMNNGFKVKELITTKK